MESLKGVRGEIDCIDDELVTLFVRRQNLLRKVAEAKKVAGEPISDPQREREILARVASEVPPEYESGSQLLFSTLFAISKARQLELVKGESVRKLQVAVIGLGLIGGSFLKAAMAAGHAVNAVHHGDATGFEKAELVLVCLPPDATVPWIREHAHLFRRGAIVVDICGVKRGIVSEMSTVPRGEWTFVGGHPMAGREVSGFANAKADLFVGASMILTPQAGTDPVLIDEIKGFFASLGFAETVVTTPERHDDMIAFTSQLCHVIATTFSRDPRMKETAGFSAGSYANMTRIATQDAEVWSSLYCANRDALVAVLDDFAARFKSMRDAIEAEDEGEIKRMIEEGAAAKNRPTCAVASDFDIIRKHSTTQKSKTTT